MSRIGFAVGTGRCGTKFLAEAYGAAPSIASHHERHPVNDTFHRYCRWNRIDVDETGFLETKRAGIAADLADHAYSFEASAFLSLSLDVLCHRLGARVVAMVRRPDKVVTSYFNKGWYANAAWLDDPERPPSMQDVAHAHHFLGRTLPRGREFERWSGLTRIGKIAWFWNTLNRELVRQADGLGEAVLFQKLETLDYEGFRRITNHLGAPQEVSEASYRAIRSRKPNASTPAYTCDRWTARERAEFEYEVAEMAAHFGYCAQVAGLPPDKRRSESPLQGLLGPLRRQAEALLARRSVR